MAETFSITTAPDAAMAGRLRTLFATRRKGPPLWIEVPTMSGALLRLTFDPHGAVVLRVAGGSVTHRAGMTECEVVLAPDDAAELSAVLATAAEVADVGFATEAQA